MTESAAAGGRLATVAGAILLGGQSSRMGRDKARLEWRGEALVVRQARMLASLFGELLLVGGDAPAEAPGRRVADPAGEGSALRGLVGALDAAEATWVAVMATDLPGLTPDLVLALVGLTGTEADAIVPRTRGPEPLCAIYRRETVLPVALGRLDSGKLRLTDLLGELDVVWLEGDDLARVGGSAALANVNTPEEWQRFVEAAG